MTGPSSHGSHPKASGLITREAVPTLTEKTARWCHFSPRSQREEERKEDRQEDNQRMELVRTRGFRFSKHLPSLENTPGIKLAPSAH